MSKDEYVYIFETKLAEGTIIDQPNRFLMNIKLNSRNKSSSIHPLHKKRNHVFTVEAIRTSDNEWTGIKRFQTRMGHKL